MTQSYRDHKCVVFIKKTVPVSTPSRPRCIGDVFKSLTQFNFLHLGGDDGDISFHFILKVLEGGEPFSKNAVFKGPPTEIQIICMFKTK